ncbi:P-loop containing nucleoside triphosphate hydrolase protein, partial [Atractiella rhizophila]
MARPGSESEVEKKEKQEHAIDVKEEDELAHLDERARRILVSQVTGGELGDAFSPSTTAQLKEDSKKGKKKGKEGKKKGAKHAKESKEEKKDGKGKEKKEEPTIPPLSSFQLFRFHTPFELFLNFIGLISACAVGALQPVQIIVFGSLTTSFINFGSALLPPNSTSATPDPSSIDPAALAHAKDKLFHDVSRAASIMVGLGGGMFLASFLHMTTWVWTGERATIRIRRAYLRGTLLPFFFTLKSSSAYFDKVGPGEIATRIQADTSLIQSGISDKVPITLSFLSVSVAGFIIAFYRNARLAGVISTIIPAIALTVGSLGYFGARYKTRVLDCIAEEGTLSEEAIVNVRTVKAFGIAKKLDTLFSLPNERARALGVRGGFFHAAGLGLMFFVVYAAYALAFWYGTTLIIDGSTDGGEIVTIFATIDRVPPIDSASEAGKKLEKVTGLIEIQNLDFIYPARPKVQVLKGVSAIFPPGKTTALVGASGSGKSTIVCLLERFYDPIAGTISLDGVDINDLNVKWLRSQIGLVAQEPTLFKASIKENIAYGLVGTEWENAEEEKVRELVAEAAKKANAHDFVMGFSEGYETKIGERGMLLSGGQKQRIAIARAIISNPPILLLDEATSALDSNSEVLVQDALDKASAGRTTISIAHRLSTIRNAEQIICMANGEIVERGTHNELMDLNGTY